MIMSELVVAKVIWKFYLKVNETKSNTHVTRKMKENLLYHKYTLKISE